MTARAAIPIASALRERNLCMPRMKALDSKTGLRGS
jgi:hypothetical protein